MTLAKLPTQPPPADGELTEQRRALGDLYRERYGDYVALALLTSGRRHGAEDLVQDAFAAAYRRSEPLEDVGALSGYVARSVINGARAAARRQRLRDRLEVDDAAPPVRSAESAAVAAGDREVVRSALARLPQRQRECAVCHFLFGLSHRETAEVLELRIGTVKTHLERARRALARELEEHT